MDKEIYINAIASISAQPEGFPFSGKLAIYHQNIIPAIPRNYKKYIPAMSLRRMSSVVKMGVSAAKMCLEEAGNPIPDAIITGTGEGCKQDTEKFLESLLEQDETLLSPTSFIQSTHNTVGGQIALALGCTAYNITYTQNAASLESAFLDAQLKFEEDDTEHILLGGVDEISPKTTSFLYLNNRLKNEEIKNLDLFKTNSVGSITSEGAHFFSFSSKKNKNAYAKFIGVSVFPANTPDKVGKKLDDFLKVNNVSHEEIDMLILGKNGDINYDYFYDGFSNQVFKDTQQLVYKHLVGDYNTANGYAVWLACMILKTGLIPEVLKLNAIVYKKPKFALLYNQNHGENHSFILMKSCEI